MIKIFAYLGNVVRMEGEERSHFYPYFWIVGNVSKCLLGLLVGGDKHVQGIGTCCFRAVSHLCHFDMC